jgi:hypothetical protein
MAVRNTVEIPERLYRTVRERAQRRRVSVQSLLIAMLKAAYPGPKKKSGRLVTGPPIKRTGKLGPLMPTDENPHGPSALT